MGPCGSTARCGASTVQRVGDAISLRHVPAGAWETFVEALRRVPAPALYSG
ncbi:MAG: hypothetical protein HY909_09170 [Deltaproteobacteria bacterium]|nr:hypothetical protein [Deltaproteobacteria bacterium]